MFKVHQFANFLSYWVLLSWLSQRETSIEEAWCPPQSLADRLLGLRRTESLSGKFLLNRKSDNGYLHGTLQKTNSLYLTQCHWSCFDWQSSPTPWHIWAGKAHSNGVLEVRWRLGREWDLIIFLFVSCFSHTSSGRVNLFRIGFVTLMKIKSKLTLGFNLFLFGFCFLQPGSIFSI